MLVQSFNQNPEKILYMDFLFQSDYIGVLRQNPKLLTGPPWATIFIGDNLQTRFNKGGTLTNPIFGCLQIKKWMCSAVVLYWAFLAQNSLISAIFDMTSFPSGSNFLTLLQRKVEYFLCTFWLYMGFLPFS